MSNRPRCVVLGLDGLPLNLACKLSANLPNLARIANKATSMQAELPELSPVNWTSFQTGTGPEEHGVFGFTRIDPVTYQLSITNAQCVRVPTIFQTIGERGLISRVINLPNTYPASPMNGSLIAGFVAPDLDRAVYPRPLALDLARRGYLLEADTNAGARDIERMLSQLSLTLDSRLMALDLLWPDIDWDMFVLVLTETDRLFHFFFPAVNNPDHPLHLPCLELLIKWDRLIGDFLDRFEALPDPKKLMVLADHGFTELITEVDLNVWLRQNGYLHMTGLASSEWDATVIGPESKAFAMDPSRIVIHTKDRFSRGKVNQTDVKKLKMEISHGLAALTWNGQQVIEGVLDGEELYPGSDSPDQPDLVCVARPGFDLKAKFDRDEIFGLFGRFGTHTVHDAIFYDSDDTKALKVRDAGQIALKFFEITQ